ncbi:hypothetical protein C1646_777567 [Rhizophagus diaphanus]|nr:hypothetical protein C1646_777567 [Rhizophagus diaphanus] [Rhizophagus sp. MUCL 43196]
MTKGRCPKNFKKPSKNINNNKSNSNQDNITKSPMASPSSSSSRSPSTNQRKKLHLDVFSPIVLDMAPQIIIDNIERNLSVERISHKSTVFSSIILRSSPANLLSDEHLVTVDSRVLDKILEKCKKNTFFLRELLQNQTKFEAKIDDISDDLKRLKEDKKVFDDVKGKAKSKPSDAFYYVFSDNEVKEKFKDMLENDKVCTNYLKELKKKGTTYDRLWNEKLYSEILAANRIKKGYYICHVKDSLWSTFGISRLKPFDESFTRDQMRDWKNDNNVKKAYEDLYSANNPESETYISLIIKNVFISEKEHTQKNAIWTQAILEIIFNEGHLSPKIDSNTIDTRYTKLIASLNKDKETTISPEYSESEKGNEE